MTQARTNILERVKFVEMETLFIHLYIATDGWKILP
jgi:hypothetical protein